MHEPVMQEAVLDGLAVKKGGRYIDATVGDGGHTLGLLERMGQEGRLLGLDRDERALAVARSRLADWAQACLLVQTNFEALGAVADAHGFGEVDGVLFDLGVRSAQLDEAERGFSFMQDGPLDMRMDQSENQSAADLVNQLPEAELADLIWRLGEEKASRRIAAAIVRRRMQKPFERTADLADVVGRAAGGRRGRIHPATRTFMALRMAVNGELQAIEAGLVAAIQRLAPQGRVAVLTYHSLEDRLVKQLFGRHIGRNISLPEGGERWEGELPRLERITRKPLIADEDEVKVNPRARSAKLRIVERMLR